VTIPDIDAVVDSGEERRTEVRDGVAGLDLAAISQADCLQRAGRAGRTRPGVYVLCSDLPLERRLQYPPAEIERSRLDQMVLRLKLAGLDATELEFFHQPDREALLAAKATLGRLGAFDEQGHVTKIGRRMSRLPVDVHLARMVVEAQRLGVLDDVLTIVACVQAGGLRDRTGSWRDLTDELESDLLAELDVYHAASRLRGNQLRDAGIFPNAYRRAREIRGNLSRAARLDSGAGRAKRAVDRSAVLRACVAGMVDQLYRHEWADTFGNGDDRRQLARESVLNGTADVEWIAGRPFDLQPKGSTGVLRLLTFASKVDPRWLAELAPQLVTTSTRYVRYSSEHERVIVDHVTVFNGQEITVEQMPAPPSHEAADVLAWALVRGETGHEAEAHNAKVRAVLADLHVRSNGQVRLLDDWTLHAMYLGRVGQVSGLREIADLDLTLNLDDYAARGQREEIDRVTPRTIGFLGWELVVVYHSGAEPTVRLPGDMVDSGRWRELPDAGVRLPSGRAVRLEHPAGAFGNVDVAQFKLRLADQLNHYQFVWWQDRPAIVSPIVSPAPAEIPQLVTATYGSDALTGQPLLAYGTPVVHRISYSSAESLFSDEWFPAKAEALAARARFEAEFLRRCARLLAGREYPPTTVDPDQLESWTEETEALVREARATSDRG
jgi:ATP-dependent helicase HrpA